MKKKIFLLLMIFFIAYGCSEVYSPTIIKNPVYSSFDIAIKWKFYNNKLFLSGYNNFWTEIFDFEITLTPVDKNMKSVGKSYKKYIGSLDMDEKFNLTCQFTCQNIYYIKLDYYYTFYGYNSSGTRLNYYTYYLKVK